MGGVGVRVGTVGRGVTRGLGVVRRRRVEGVCILMALVLERWELRVLLGEGCG